MGQHETDRLNDLLKQSNEIIGSLPSHRIKIYESYNRFALQWLSRVEFNAEPIKSELPTDYKSLKLIIGTSLIALTESKQDSIIEVSKNGSLMYMANVARQQCYFDSFEGDLIRTRFEWLGGWITSIFVNAFNVPARAYDIRLIAQMSCPKLWKLAQISDCLSKNQAEEIRILGTQHKATDKDGLCGIMPAVATREMRKYIEEHMIKDNVSDEFAAFIDNSMKDLVSLRNDDGTNLDQISKG